MTIRLITLFLIGFLLNACHSSTDKSDSGNKISTIPNINYQLINSYPHDTASFTEGFLIHHGELFESTGATRDLPQTKSLFGKVNLATGKIDVKVQLDRIKYFGEGITFLKGKVFQLTYKTKVGFVYDANTFKKIREFTFPSQEGWGMTTDGANLIMSDGTNTLTYLDPNTLQVVKTIAVSENGYVTDNVNELEYINGSIYANIWATNRIVKIDPKDGNVTGKLDLTNLADEAKRIFPGSLEMNGIAYDSTTNRVFVTGKLWPKIYEIEFSH